MTSTIHSHIPETFDVNSYSTKNFKAISANNFKPKTYTKKNNNDLCCFSKETTNDINHQSYDNICKAIKTIPLQQLSQNKQKKFQNSTFCKTVNNVVIKNSQQFSSPRSKSNSKHMATCAPNYKYSRQIKKDTRTISHKRSGHLKNVISEETMFYVFKFLTPYLVKNAVDSLYLDRIRPLLIDVLQRLKYQLKQANNNQIDKVESRTNSNTNLTKNSENDLEQFIAALDTCSLYFYISAECSTVLSLKVQPVSDDSTLVLKKFFPHNKATVNAVTPSLASIIGQSEVISLNPPEEALPWVDPHDPHNFYSDVVWRSFNAFLISQLLYSKKCCAHDSLMPYQFKGGRYGLALELKNTKFPALKSMSLGELCHLVQLAIKTKLLAYEHSVLQPVASCYNISEILLCFDENNEKFKTDFLNPKDWPAMGNETTITEPLDDSNNFLSLQTNWRIYESLEEFATDLNLLLLSKPEGIVTAQLKKALQTKFSKGIFPQKFGYKKLTECLTQNSIIRSVCQVVCLNPLSDCLLLIHPKYKQLLNSQMQFDTSCSMPSPASQSTAAGSDHTFSTLLDCSIQSTPQQQNKLIDPNLFTNTALTPIPSITNITYLAWASTKNSMIINCSNQRKVCDTFANDNVWFDDDYFIYDCVNKIIQNSENFTNKNAFTENNLLPPVYEIFWDCYML